MGMLALICASGSRPATDRAGRAFSPGRHGVGGQLFAHQQLGGAGGDPVWRSAFATRLQHDEKRRLISNDYG
jgi:hypothetical protein